MPHLSHDLQEPNRRPGLRWLAPLFLLLTGASACGPREAAPPTTPPARQATPVEGAVSGRRAPTAVEAGVVRRLAEQTARARDLEFRESVHVDIETADRIAASLLDQITEEDVAKARDVYGALGMLPPDVDVRALLEGVLGEQVVGYYDTDSERLVVREDVMTLLVRHVGGDNQDSMMARLTIAHELVHALQDQHLGLDQLDEADLDSDAESAFRAVVEGDATFAMMVQAGVQNGASPADAGQILATAAAAQPVNLNALTGTEPNNASLRDAPAILRVTLVAPYMLGLRVAALSYQQGGWSAVNALFETPPSTTEQLLHPEKMHMEASELVSLPEFAHLNEAGFELVDEDTLGELELSVYLASNQPQDVNAEAAAGWAGDRLRVYRRSGDLAVVWWLLFDTPEDATEATAAAADLGGNVSANGRAAQFVRGLTALEQQAVNEAFQAFAATHQ